MGFFAALRQIFSLYTYRSARSKKIRLFFIISMVPVVVLLVAKILEIAQPSARISAEEIFSRILLVIYIQLLLPIMALFFGSSIVQEEVENRTLVFLTTAPISRSSILLGKYLSYLLLSVVIVHAGFIFSFIIINLDHLGGVRGFGVFLNFMGVGLLALASYIAFFALLGTVFRKSLILGLMFIFGWESIVQYFPGTTQKFTLIHYVKSLLPASSGNVKFLVLRLEPSPAFESMAVLIGIALISLIAASVVFKRKEYSLRDNLS